MRFFPPLTLWRDQFQGIVLVRHLHAVGQILNALYCGLWLLWELGSGREGEKIFSVIFYPILFIVQACIIRVMSELAVSVLLVPVLLAARRPNGGGATDVVHNHDDTGGIEV